MRDRLETLLAEAQALAHIGSWEWDLLANRVTWSDEHYRLFDFPVGASLDYEKASSRTHPADRARAQQVIQQSLKDGQPYILEFRIVLPDGTQRWIEARGRAEVDAAGRVIRKVGTSQDITERAEVAAALRHAESQYRELIENAVEGVFRSTPQGRFLMANQSLARMLGYESPEQLIAERDLTRDHYVRSDERSRITGLGEAQGVVQGFEYEAYRRDGSTVWLRAHARVVREPGGTTYYEGMVEDVTHRRRA